MKGRRQLLTVVGLVGSGALILVAGLFLVILPQHSKIGKLHTQFDETQTQILSIEATRAGPQSVGASQLYELSRAMPPTDDMPGVLLDLSRAAAASQTTVMSVRPAADITLPDGSVAVPLQVVVDGKFAGIARFLGNLRRAVSVRGSDVRATSRLFLVDNVGISANTTSTGTGCACERRHGHARGRRIRLQRAGLAEPDASWRPAPAEARPRRPPPPELRQEATEWRLRRNARRLRFATGAPRSRPRCSASSFSASPRSRARSS